MKITEKRLRQIIRSVIKESQMNEIVDMNFPMDSLAGSAAHGGIDNPLYQTVYPKEFYGDDPENHSALMPAAEAVGLSGRILGVLMLSAGHYTTGGAVLAGSALYMLIKNYLETGSIMPESEHKKVLDALEKLEKDPKIKVS